MLSKIKGLKICYFNNASPAPRGCTEGARDQLSGLGLAKEHQLKKTADVKYPHSANLFLFCRRVLDHKFGGIRVIDQDVGQILGFDPADCSHWKKGKKNIRSIQAMKSIADHLGVDEKLVVDVAGGDMDDREAFFEFSGYGAFSLDNKTLEAAKKDFYRRYSGNWSKDKEQEFKTAFAINEAAIDQVVAAIHERINFQEPPLYIPEVVSAFVELQVSSTQALADAAARATAATENRLGEQIKVSDAGGSDMRPDMRFRLAKGMAVHFLHEMAPKATALGDYAQHLFDVQSNLFAAKLLAPAALIRREMGQVNVVRDVVTQLAEAFWVSKTFMNRRLKDILQSQSGL